jgi:hypothetical protein
MSPSSIGGPATAAIIANGALGLMGFGLALGSWLALGLGLAICVGWNRALMRINCRAR